MNLKIGFKYWIYVFLSLMFVLSLILLSVFGQSFFYFSSVSIIFILILLFLGMYLILVFLTYLEYKNHQKNQRLQEQLLLQESVQLLKEEIDSLEHNLSQAYQSLSNALFEFNDPENAVECLQSVSVETLCAHPLLNALFIYKKHQIEKYHNYLILEGDLPESIAIKESDLISLVSNLLDNAIQATKTIENSKVFLKVMKIKNTLQIRITNQRVCSDTHSDWRHGFGTKIIKEIIDKYHGELQIQKDENQYSVYCLLLLEEESL